jgi:hypothetical protein
VVRPEEIDYLEHDHLGALVAHVSEGDRQDYPPKRGRFFARDHSVEQVWAALELVTGEPQPLKGVEVYEVEATTPPPHASMRALVSQVIPPSGLTMRGNLPGLGMLFG